MRGGQADSVKLGFFLVIMLAALLIKLPPGMTLASIRALRKGKPFIDTHLFKSGSFNRLFGIGFLISFTYFLPFHFMAEYAYEYGWSAATGAMLIAVMNAMAGTGRLLIGLTSDYLGIFNLMCMTLLVPSVSIFLLWPWSGPYLGLMIVFSIFFGFFSGWFGERSFGRTTSNPSHSHSPLVLYYRWLYNPPPSSHCSPIRPRNPCDRPRYAQLGLGARLLVRFPDRGRHRRRAYDKECSGRGGACGLDSCDDGEFFV